MEQFILLYFIFENYKAAHLTGSNFGWLYNRLEHLDEKKLEVSKVDWDVYLSEKT